MTPVFLAGPLRDERLRACVAGAALAGRDAVLPDTRSGRVAGTDHPALIDAPGEDAPGVLARPALREARRIAFYAAGCGLRRSTRRVRLAASSEELDAIVYHAPGAAPDAAPWSFRAWHREDAASARYAATEAMAYLDRIDGADLHRMMPTIRMRAASRARAGAETAPHALRFAAPRAAVEVADHRIPYANYFAVAETDLVHPHFDGGQSAPLTRAALASGDAVTVLPYDPVRDRVLVIEQFRFGPFTRGDSHPWVLEPIAGRIDPGETPEAAARREAVEEAGLELGRLVEVGRYYPSPGVMTEYLFSYVALADLPDGTAGLGGEEAEGEDIRGHVIAFERLMALVATGEVNTGPLLLCALWLKAERARLA